jgi:UDP-N-acetylmuramoylalanine--D-glutamate ligase
MSYGGRRVTIMGLGHFGGGAAAARWLARQGAVVTVTDLADDNTLADSLAELAGEAIADFHLGGHREEDFRRADLVVVNPAVRPDNRFLEIAGESGARLSSEIELFMEACPARIVGVTGSNGKSTTAGMTAAILAADGRRAWLGGNIGGSLLGQLDRMGPGDWVVLEISSFQLWHLAGDARMPEVAVVTGCSPNHLDWHGSYERYVAAKQRILSGQTPADLAVLNAHDAEVGSWCDLVRGRLLGLPNDDEIPPLCVRGEHNRVNAACAAAAAMGIGCDRAAIARGLGSFRPLPQRLERVAVVDGRTFYNDSAATTPEATVAALEALDAPVWLVAGGHDKGCDF